MLYADVLTFREFSVREPLPLATVHDAVLEVLKDRDDVVLCGATAVNAYVDEPRSTRVLAVLSTEAVAVAEELRDYLHQKFHVAIRVRSVAEGRGLRVFQVQKTGNRDVADVRQVEALPAAERVEDVLVLAPAELIASKVMAYHQRRGQPKSGTDWRDIAMLLLAFPELKDDPQPVMERLRTAGASLDVLEGWQELAAQEYQVPSDDDGY